MGLDLAALAWYESRPDHADADQEPAVRIRTMFAMSAGAALGAGAMYLLDPEHGDARRREAVTRAAERGRAELTDTTRELSRRAVVGARGLADQARTGFVAASGSEVGTTRTG